MKVQFLVIALSLLVLPQCSYKKYQVKRLNNLTQETATYTETKEHITVKAKKFTAEESREFFYDVDLISDKKKPVQPVHITIENNRSKPINCNIQIQEGMRISKAQLAQQLHVSCGAIVAMVYTSGVAGWLLLAGSCVGFVVAGTTSTSLVIPGILFAAGGLCLLGFPLYATHYRLKANNLIDEQLALNSLYKNNYVDAGDTLNGLVYCKGLHNTGLTVIVREDTKIVTTFGPLF